MDKKIPEELEKILAELEQEMEVYERLGNMLGAGKGFEQ